MKEKIEEVTGVDGKPRVKGGERSVWERETVRQQNQEEEADKNTARKRFRSNWK